jgi:hypothetical protein
LESLVLTPYVDPTLVRNNSTRKKVVKMRHPMFLSLAVITLIGCAGTGLTHQVDESTSTRQIKISPQLWSKVQGQDTVSVIVQVNVPWYPEAHLSKEGVAAQRKAHAAAQSEILAQLKGTKYTIRHQFESGGMSLDVGEQALAMLTNSLLVLSVGEVISGTLP